MADTNRGGVNFAAGSGERITGGFEVPEGAPMEVTQPLQAGAEAERRSKARANERSLKPLVFEGGGLLVKPPATAVTPDAPVAEVAPAPPPPPIDHPAPPLPTPVRSAVRSLASKVLRRSGLARPPVVITAPASKIATVEVGGAPATPSQSSAAQQELAAFTDAPAVPLADDLAAEAARQDAEDRARFPAYSDTDSPSRGVPRQIDDPGKRITGGFTDAMDGQYFPLNGQEVAQLVRSVLDQIDQQMATDLRFSLACVYPRVRVVVKVEVEAFAHDEAGGGGTAELRRVAVHDKTPLEIAEALGDEVCFVVRATANEVDDAGNPEQPPDALRKQLGMDRPRKRVIEGAGGQRFWVDR